VARGLLIEGVGAWSEPALYPACHRPAVLSATERMRRFDPQLAPRDDGNWCFWRFPVSDEGVGTISGAAAITTAGEVRVAVDVISGIDATSDLTTSSLN
jgi:hypothetical protein